MWRKEYTGIKQSKQDQGEGAGEVVPHLSMWYGLCNFNPLYADDQ